ncbi:ROK family transcriptional regulator [Salisediminibacterium selenitireducens]|uniref:ROK family protein n=1 Tax=Bacillus selenitireducens (strain ATCC 700615 / DSM 15326 / MLS10) TaxID=439292 RepID=D6XX94_BACIE|nr:ROK family transcriptional regulator [Salisediminibacterium selenitireducens]ADH97951.1 ROK family protein [[Bacillus] selenitireducens MLS10]
MVQGMTGSFRLMKSLNRSLVINIIRRKGPISRTDISKQANLTPPTVTNIVNDLLKEGLVKEGRTGASKGGRRPVLLSINYNNHYVIGVDVGTGQIRVGLSNLNAELLNRKKETLPAGIKAGEFMTILYRLVDDMITNSDVSRDKIVGIGIGMHGIVDEEKGISIYAPHFDFGELPLKERLEARYEIPVKVENDARCSAIAEMWFGDTRANPNLVFINVGDGIGAGVILNGQIHRGHHHIAGELGHMIVDLNGRQCTCGSYGCLHTVASGIHIRERAIHEITLGRSTALREMRENKEDIDGEVIYEAALHGDEFAEELFAQAGRFLGLAVTNVINFLNPDQIVLGGGVMKAGAFVMKPLVETVNRRALTDDARKTEITVSSLGSHSALLGAVSLILHDVFEVQDR